MEEEDILFKSDHEFSCESDVPDGEIQEVKHARTATKRKRGRKPKGQVQTIDIAESEGKNFLL